MLCLQTPKATILHNSIRKQLGINPIIKGMDFEPLNGTNICCNLKLNSNSFLIQFRSTLYIIMWKTDFLHTGLIFFRHLRQ